MRHHRRWRLARPPGRGRAPDDDVHLQEPGRTGRRADRDQRRRYRRDARPYRLPRHDREFRRRPRGGARHDAARLARFRRGLCRQDDFRRQGAGGCDAGRGAARLRGREGRDRLAPVRGRGGGLRRRPGSVEDPAPRRFPRLRHRPAPARCRGRSQRPAHRHAGTGAARRDGSGCRTARKACRGGTPWQ